jgi:phospholipase/carboxylesterase
MTDVNVFGTEQANQTGANRKSGDAGDTRKNRDGAVVVAGRWRAQDCAMLSGAWIEAESASNRTLVVLHGLGDTHDGWSWLPEALGLPWLNYLLLDAPDDYYGGYAWYDLYGDSASGIRRSREALHEVLRHRDTPAHPASETAVLGFSQGCVMALEAGMRFRPPLKGIVGISGYVWEPERLLREAVPAPGRPPVLMTHGRQDPLIPIAQVRLQAEELKTGGFDLEWREFQKAHTVAGEEELSVIRGFLTRVFGMER